MDIFSNFGSEVVNGFLGVNTLKDFTHASKTFLSNGYELAPRLKFQYHVYFDINKAEIPGLQARYDAQSQIDLGVLVKNIQLPKYSIETEELNQYNRKRIIQTKINYDDISLSLHDDSANLTRNLWYDYMTYYFKDSVYPFKEQGANNNNQPAPGFKYGERDLYKAKRSVTEWGYDGETGGVDAGGFGNDATKPIFFNSIKIFGMDKKRFVCYVLINPHITSFQHDEYNYSEAGGTMANNMTLAYETVKYYEGNIDRSGIPVDGFASPARYDKEPSSLGTAGSSASIFGQAGLLDASNSIISDLSKGNIAGAVRTAGISARTVSSAGIKNILKNEGASILKDAINSPRGRFPVNKPASIVPVVANRLNIGNNNGTTK